MPWSRSPRRWRARSITSRTSFTPAVTADSCSKARAVRPGDGERERRLAGARRPPQQHRRQPVLLDEPAQRAAGPEQLGLADDVVDRARPQPGGQRRLACAGAPRRPREKQVVTGSPDAGCEPRPVPARRRAGGTARRGRRANRGSTHRQARNSRPSGVGSTSSSSDAELEPAVDLAEPAARADDVGGPLVDDPLRRARRPARRRRRPSPVSSLELAPRRLDGASPRLEPALGQLPLARARRPARTPAPARRRAARRRRPRPGSDDRPRTHATDQVLHAPATPVGRSHAGLMPGCRPHMCGPRNGGSCRAPWRCRSPSRTRCASPRAPT